MNKSKKWLVALSVVTAMAASGIAMAASSPEQNVVNCKPPHAAKGEFRGGMKDFQQNHAKLLELLKMDAETFKKEMKSGKTLAAIAKEHGVSEQNLTDFITKQMTQGIDDGVKAGRLTADQAAKMKTDMPSRIADMINGKGPIHKGPGPRPGHGPFDDTKLLELLKLDKDTLRTEIKSGKTLAAIAGEHGVSEQELKDFFTSQMTQRIEEDVKAGRLPADRAEEMKAHIADHVNDMISGKGPMHRGHGPRGAEPPKA